MLRFCKKKKIGQKWKRLWENYIFHNHLWAVSTVQQIHIDIFLEQNVGDKSGSASSFFLLC